MRIRKNANISAFLYTNSNISSYNHGTSLCKLNQSPWDIITFPSSHSSSPSLHQFDDFHTHYNVNFAAHRCSLDSIGAIQSGLDNVNGNVDEVMNDFELCEKEEKLGFLKKDEEMVLCGNNTNGDIMCEDHFVDIKDDAVLATKKKVRPVSKSSMSYTRKRPVAKTSNPDEFYYYSGFGPTWGKKRGELGNNSTTSNACDTIISCNSNVDGDVGAEQECKRFCKVGPKTEDLDYMEEKQDNEKEKAVKKRGRRPIKARSLKSLM